MINLRLFVLLCLFLFCRCKLIRDFPQYLSKEELKVWLRHRIQSHSADRSDLELFEQDGSSEQFLLEEDGFEEDPFVRKMIHSNEPLSQDLDLVNGNLCNKCSPGFGLVNMCTAETPTVCEPCQDGANFSHSESHFKPCMPCSRCGVGMYTEIECTVELDTFCDSCEAARQAFLTAASNPNFRNSDFLDECGPLKIDLGDQDLQKLIRDVQNDEHHPLVDSAELSPIDESDDIEEIDTDDDQSPPILAVSNQLVHDFDEIQSDIVVDDAWMRKNRIFVDFAPQFHPKMPEPDPTTEIVSTTTSTHVATVPAKPMDQSLGGGDNKLSSSLIGGFEVKLLPEPLGLDETDFGHHRPLIGRKNRKTTTSPSLKSTTVAAKNAPNPELILPENDSTFDGKSFISGWLNGYDPNEKKSAKKEESKPAQAVIFKPTNHEYPYIRLLHPDQFRALILKQRQKIITAAILVILLLLVFVLLLKLNCARRRRRQNQNKSLVWSSGLSDLEDKVIHECVEKIANNNRKNSQKSRLSNLYRRNPFDNEIDDQNQPEYFEDDFESNLVENPLVAFLDQKNYNSASATIVQQYEEKSSKNLPEKVPEKSTISSIVNV